MRQGNHFLFVQFKLHRKSVYYFCILISNLYCDVPEVYVDFCDIDVVKSL